MATKSKLLQIRLTEGEHKDLQAQAKLEDRTISNMVVRIMNVYLREKAKERAEADSTAGSI